MNTIAKSASTVPSKIDATARKINFRAFPLVVAAADRNVNGPMR